jgi:uncharacterized membrane protein
LAKALLLGIVWFTAIVPLALATARNPKRALRTVCIISLLGIAFWSYLALVRYPIYVPLWQQMPK